MPSISSIAFLVPRSFARSLPTPRKLLGPKSIYSSYEEMLEHEGLGAVIVVTVTKVHAEMSEKALEKGLHVLCEKPLSTNVELVRSCSPVSNSQSSPSVG